MSPNPSPLQQIEEKLLQYEADSKMISERALQRTVMDESGGSNQFRTIKSIPNRQEWVEVASRRNTGFRSSVRLVSKELSVRS